MIFIIELKTERQSIFRKMAQTTSFAQTVSSFHGLALPEAEMSLRP
jgi:hypothetical protein